MLDAPQIIQTTAQLTAVIHLTVPREEIRDVMGPSLNELIAEVAAQGLKPTGPWFTHHLRMAPEIFDFEICLPVPTAVAASGRMRPSLWPSTKVARAIYHGPYEHLGEAWGELMDWMDTNGYSSAADLYECYVAGPESSSDPNQWQTQLSRPLI